MLTQAGGPLPTRVSSELTGMFLACMNIAIGGTVLAACAHSEDKREALGRMQRLV